LQRLQLWFGIALVNTGSRAEGQEFLFAAAKGSCTEFSESALEHLSAFRETLIC